MSETSWMFPSKSKQSNSIQLILTTQDYLIQNHRQIAYPMIGSFKVSHLSYSYFEPKEISNIKCDKHKRHNDKN